MMRRHRHANQAAPAFIEFAKGAHLGGAHVYIRLQVRGTQKTLPLPGMSLLDAFSNLG